VQPVRARVGGGGEHVEHGVKVGLRADELHVVRLAPVVRLGPPQGELVQLAPFLRHVIVRALRRAVQARDLQRAVTQHVAVDGLGAALRVQQPAPTRAHEAHGDRKPGFVQRRDPAHEDMPSVAQGPEPAQERNAGQIGPDALIQHQQHIARCQVLEPCGARAVSTSLDAQQPELRLPQHSERGCFRRIQARALPGETVECRVPARRWGEQGEVCRHAEGVGDEQHVAVGHGRAGSDPRQPPARCFLHPGHRDEVRRVS